MTRITVLQCEGDFFDFLDEIEESKKEESIYMIRDIIEMIGFPLTIMCEMYYVDKVFRDSYYEYFASKHQKINRNCKRLAFFKGCIPSEAFLNYKSNENILQENFAGIMVLRPLKVGTVGRTLLAPDKLNIKSCYVRLTEFSVIIFGHKLHINAFPFSAQDSETMTCAETTVWNILEYYGTRYSEYKTVLPSDIIHELNKITQERNLPSRGFDYYKVSTLLKLFGFAPRLYANREYEKEYYTMKKIFHYYVESGIPLAVGISAKDKNDAKIGHSIVCIGHAMKKKELKNMKCYRHNEVPYIDSSEYYDKYVIMDDNQIPYKIEDYHEFTLFNNSEVDIFAVPLYKRIYLEAGDASQIIYEILYKKEIGFHKWIQFISEKVDETNPIVVRIFLTSSRKYKAVRAASAGNKAVSSFYSDFIYPKFLWVAEISTHSSYNDGKIYGEIVLDATASRFSGLESLLFIRYLSNVGYKEPDESLKDLLERLNKKYKYFTYPYELYRNNLSLGGVNHD